MNGLPDEFAFSPESAILIILAFILFFIAMILLIVVVIPFFSMVINSKYCKHKNFRLFLAISSIFFVIAFHTQLAEFVDLILSNGITKLVIMFTVFCSFMTVFYLAFQKFLFDVFANPLRSSNLRKKIKLDNNGEKISYNSWLNTLQREI